MEKKWNDRGILNSKFGLKDRRIIWKTDSKFSENFSGFFSIRVWMTPGKVSQMCDIIGVPLNFHICTNYIICACENEPESEPSEWYILIWMMKAFGLNWAGAVNHVHLVGYALMFASQKYQIFGRFEIFSNFFSKIWKFWVFNFITYEWLC